MSETYLSLKDIKNLPQDMLPMMCLSNGFTSLFGYLITLRTKAFWSHFQWLVTPEQFASQWFWFKTFPVDHFSKHSLKLWHNPFWTKHDRAVLQQVIIGNLAKTKWETHYDVVGVIGELFGWDWMNQRGHDFCSETLNILALVDPAYREWMKDSPSPTPEEANAWLKTQPNYEVYGRVMPG
jgi:hypothetical protein